MDESVQQAEPELKGIGGWLIPIAIGLILGIIIQAYHAVHFAFIFLGPTWRTLTNPDSAAYNFLWEPTLIFEFISHVILLCYLTVLGGLFFSHSRLFPKLTIIFYIFCLIDCIIDFLLTEHIPFIAQHTKLIEKGEFIIFRTVLICIIWIPYFCISRRVKNTFVE